MRLDEFLANRDAYRSEPSDDAQSVRDIIVSILERYMSDDGDSAYELFYDDNLDELGCCTLSEIALRIMYELRSFLLEGETPPTVAQLVSKAKDAEVTHPTGSGTYSVYDYIVHDYIWRTGTDEMNSDALRSIVYELRAVLNP